MLLTPVGEIRPDQRRLPVLAPRKKIPVKFSLFSIGLLECVGGLPDMSGRIQTKDGTARASVQPGRTLSFHAKLADARQRRAALQVTEMEPANLPHSAESKDIIPADAAVAGDRRRSSLAPVRTLALLLGISIVAGVGMLQIKASGENAAPVAALPEPDTTLSPILAAIPFQRPSARPNSTGVTDQRAPVIIAEAETLPTVPQHGIAAPAVAEKLTWTAGRPAVLRPTELGAPERPGAGPAVFSAAAAVPDLRAIEDRTPRRMIGGTTDRRPEPRSVVMPASILTDTVPAVPDTLVSQPPVAVARPAPRPVAALVPVVFHTPARSTQDQTDALRADAFTAGFDLGEARHQPVRIRAANVRYYHPEDRENAARLAEATGAELRDFTWFRPQPANGTLELWAEGRSGLPAAEPERPGVFEGIRRDLGLIRRDIANLFSGDR